MFCSLEPAWAAGKTCSTPASASKFGSSNEYSNYSRLLWQKSRRLLNRKCQFIGLTRNAGNCASVSWTRTGNEALRFEDKKTGPGSGMPNCGNTTAPFRHPSWQISRNRRHSISNQQFFRTAGQWSSSRVDKDVYLFREHRRPVFGNGRDGVSCSIYRHAFAISIQFLSTTAAGQGYSPPNLLFMNWRFILIDDDDREIAIYEWRQAIRMTMPSGLQTVGSYFDYLRCGYRRQMPSLIEDQDGID